ncbi:MAG TPA: CHAD domain-containing protein [Candidatus Angelobacter sp.]|nr:CHAD domain-containing protein [Candidatus Angelobacter sp.]
MKASFAATYARTRKILTKRLKAYLKDPNPENVRSLRIAMRRMTLSTDLLPKKIRKAKTTQAFLTSLDQASKANAKVRDLDIILSKISTYKPEESLEVRIMRIKETRDSQLQAARRQTIALQKEPIPRLKEKELSVTKLQKRLNKTTSELIAAINGRLPMVLKDSNDTKDLHLLRMDCRRLRYLAELFRSEKTARLLSRLRSWQSQLGYIHDSDLTISYLRNLGEAPEIQPILNDLRTQRMQSYEKFSSIAKLISPITLAS